MSHVGVTLPRALPAHQVMEYARTAEAVGFHQLWVVEDCFYRGGIAQAAAVLATTATIQVGLGILPAAARNPAITAMELSTLCELFPGRVTVGLGHGMPDWMRQIGVWPSSPLTLLEEHLRAVRGLLDGERVSTAGRYVRLDDVRLDLAPSVRPRVLAGVRGPRSLGLSGHRADGTILAEPTTPEYIRAAIATAGTPADHTWVGYAVVAVDADRGRALLRARRALQWVGEPDVRPHLAPLPFAAELAELRRVCRRPEDFARAMPEDWVEQLAVTGTPDEARRRIAELHRAGTDVVVLAPQSPDPLDELPGLAGVLDPQRL